MMEPFRWLVDYSVWKISDAKSKSRISKKQYSYTGSVDLQLPNLGFHYWLDIEDVKRNLVSFGLRTPKYRTVDWPNFPAYESVGRWESESYEPQTSSHERILVSPSTSIPSLPRRNCVSVTAPSSTRTPQADPR